MDVRVGSTRILNLRPHVAPAAPETYVAIKNERERSANIPEGGRTDASDVAGGKKPKTDLLYQDLA